MLSIVSACSSSNCLRRPSTSNPAEQLSDRSLVWNTDLVEALELENLLINAAITMHSAEQRKVRVPHVHMLCAAKWLEGAGPQTQQQPVLVMVLLTLLHEASAAAPAIHPPLSQS